MDILDRINRVLESGLKDLDSGAEGKAFEPAFLRACDLVGLRYEANTAGGSVWDFRPVGPGWRRLLAGKDVNIKIAGTHQLFSSAGLMWLPWTPGSLSSSFSVEDAEARARKVLRGVGLVAFLAPAGKDIQRRIMDLVRAEDSDGLEELMVRKNFKVERLGAGFGVRISLNREEGRIGSVALLRDGKVFARSEKPRKTGRGQKVEFKKPKGGKASVDRSVKRPG